MSNRSLKRARENSREGTNGKKTAKLLDSEFEKAEQAIQVFDRYIDRYTPLEWGLLHTIIKSTYKTSKGEWFTTGWDIIEYKTEYNLHFTLPREIISITNLRKFADDSPFIKAFLDVIPAKDDMTDIVLMLELQEDLRRFKQSNTYGICGAQYDSTFVAGDETIPQEAVQAYISAMDPKVAQEMVDTSVECIVSEEPNNQL
jgi:hypothetical protein